MFRRLLVFVALLLALLGAADRARAAGGDYTFEGASVGEQKQVRSALEASAFPWKLVPARITIHVGDYGVSHATRGHIWLDRGIVASGRFGWATIQDEYAHQLDFFLFDPTTRDRLTLALGARDWCYGVSGLAHSEYGCERFSSTLVWSYWPSRDNAYRPTSSRDESAALAPAKFRALMAALIGAPSTAAGARL
jgi:hypothetical protein